jgi:ubiquinone/menaquinone biosynthesis C-methylase UbiE
MPTTHEVKAFFESVATDWDIMRLACYNERVIDCLAERCGPTSTSAGRMTIVDVGTGTGFLAAGLAPRVERVFGIDNSPAMLDVARANLRSLGVANVELLQGDLAAIPLPDDSVGAAVANMVLHHAESPTAMLREMARVVRPGGTVGVCDEEEHTYEWMRTEHADVWLDFSAEQLERHFCEAGLEDYSAESLGTH